jgi:hypothetical protein
MKVRLDKRPQTNNQKVFFAIRLYPENNEDMTNMMWGLEVMGKIKDISMAGLTDEAHWVITFEERR